MTEERGLIQEVVQLLVVKPTCRVVGIDQYHHAGFSFALETLL